jgi:hypothetical protein
MASHENEQQLSVYDVPSQKESSFSEDLDISGNLNSPRILSPDAKLRLSEMHKLARTAQECFPLEGGDVILPKVVVPGKRTPSYMVAFDYLQEQGANPEELEELFSFRRGIWILKDQERGSIYNHAAADDINRHLRHLFHPINTVIDRALDGLSPDGFNKHGEAHVNRVVGQGLTLLDYMAADENSRKNLVIAAQAHDIGNIFGRDAHPHISPNMLQKIVPSIKDDVDSWRVINRAIVLHDSDNLRAVTSSWGNISSSERLKRLADYMRPEGLALLIADKVEVGRDRISDKILAGSIIKDPHAVVNLLGRHAGVEVFGESFIWNLKYNPEFTPAEMEKFKHFAPGWKRRNEEGEVKIGFSDWKNMFWGIYTERVITAIEAALAFFPYLENVEISMTDIRDANIGEVKTFKRDSLDLQIDNLRNEQIELKRAGVLKRR